MALSHLAKYNAMLAVSTELNAALLTVKMASIQNQNGEHFRGRIIINVCLLCMRVCAIHFGVSTAVQRTQNRQQCHATINQHPNANSSKWSSRWCASTCVRVSVCEREREALGNSTN